MKKILLFISTVLISCPILSQETLYLGGDISVLQSYEDNGVAYYDQQGAKIVDVLKYMKSEAVGWNAQRVRLFVNPSRKSPDGSTDAQVCQDIDYVVRFCKRIKEEGFALMLDFHYSDTWADPSNQWTPDAWLSLSDAELQVKVYDYTKECLQKLVDAGATPDFIQTGNEISYGMLWGSYDPSSNANRCYSNSPDANWERFVNLLTEATRACREVCPQAKIIIHTERSGDPAALTDIYSRLSSIDYDIIGLSYYPFWHNSLSTLSQSLTQLALDYPDKKVQIVETAYYYQWQPAVGSGITFDFASTWSVSPEGQAAYAKDLIAELKLHPNVNGLYWWFPEENGGGPASSVLTGWVNRGLWDNTTHRALPALYILKTFLEGGTGVNTIRCDKKPSVHWYTLHGQQLDNRPNNTGIYIHNAKKVIIR